MGPMTASALWARTQRVLEGLGNVFTGDAAGERARLFFVILSARCRPSWMAEQARRSRPYVNKQLAHLFGAGLVDRVRDGKIVFYVTGPCVTLGIVDGNLHIVVGDAPGPGHGGALVVLIYTAEEAAILGLGPLMEAVKAGDTGGASANGEYAALIQAGGVPAPTARDPRATHLPSAPGPTSTRP